ncbi:hypothetical protein HMI54_009343, partial [Coelomomyces lativittatus]
IVVLHFIKFNSSTHSTPLSKPSTKNFIVHCLYFNLQRSLLRRIRRLLRHSLKYIYFVKNINNNKPVIPRLMCY